METTLPLNTPVLVGVGQYMERGKPPQDSLSPMGIAAAAGQRALADTGAPKQMVAALDALVSVRIFPIPGTGPVIRIHSGAQRIPPFAIASRLGAEPDLGIYGNVGGNTPQKYINEMAGRIASGEIQAAMVVGGEALKTGQLALREGIDLDWQEQDSRAFEDRGIGESLSTPHEFAHGLGVPIQTYPLFENALRHRDQHSLQAHLESMAALMQPFNAVASQNPYAAYGEARTAQELAKVTVENRFICLPYPKWMNAMDGVNQGAAVILTSVGKARELDISEEKWVYLHGCSEANERLLVSERLNYTSSPALGMNTRQALAMAGKTLADMDCFDIYSCFPSAVAIACEELGLARDDPRGLTVTGGLPFFGGPGNNYSMHGIASMLEKLRRKRSAFGLITANGGYLTKHASGVYSCEPLDSEWQLPDSASVQSEVDGLDYPAFTETPDGDATIETYTVCFKRGEPYRAIVIGRLQASAERFLANTAAEPELLDDLIRNDWVGRRGQVRRSGELNLFEPE